MATSNKGQEHRTAQEHRSKSSTATANNTPRKAVAAPSSKNTNPPSGASKAHRDQNVKEFLQHILRSSSSAMIDPASLSRQSSINSLLFKSSDTLSSDPPVPVMPGRQQSTQSTDLAYLLRSTSGGGSGGATTRSSSGGSSGGRGSPTARRPSTQGVFDSSAAVEHLMNNNPELMKSVDAFFDKHGFDSANLDDLAEKFYSESGMPPPPPPAQPAGGAAAPSSDRFKSTDWAKDYEKTHVDVDPTKIFPPGSNASGRQISAAGIDNASNAFSDRFKSSDWKQEYAHSHVDVDPKSVFASSILRSQQQASPGSSATSVAKAAGPKKMGTDWNAMFLSNLPSASSAVPVAVAATTAATTAKPVPSSRPLPTRSDDGSNPPVPDARNASSAAGKRKRNAGSPNKRGKKDPEVKVYYEPTDQDVLLGRGGRTNHHKGNKQYLVEKEKIQPRYLEATKEEKTGISQELVDRIHELGGRFLELDNACDKWFEVTNLKARKKASQTLREINTAEERAAKRQKYGR